MNGNPAKCDVAGSSAPPPRCLHNLKNERKMANMRHLTALSTPVLKGLHTVRKGVACAREGEETSQLSQKRRGGTGPPRLTKGKGGERPWKTCRETFVRESPATPERFLRIGGPFRGCRPRARWRRRPREGPCGTSGCPPAPGGVPDVWQPWGGGPW